MLVLVRVLDVRAAGPEVAVRSVELDVVVCRAGCGVWVCVVDVFDRGAVHGDGGGEDVGVGHCVVVVVVGGVMVVVMEGWGLGYDVMR